jgi:hypothetical protein
MAADNITTQSISTLQPSWTREVTEGYAEDPQLQQLIHPFHKRT